MLYHSSRYTQINQPALLTKMVGDLAFSKVYKSEYLMVEMMAETMAASSVVDLVEKMVGSLADCKVEWMVGH